MDTEKEERKNQILQWLKKLEQESWQLELLVSAFTIYLLVIAYQGYSDYYVAFYYQYHIDGFLIFFYIFLVLIKSSIFALIIFLVLHLLLRGFWIGTIGLRSVQPKIDFSKLNYSPFFTEKLKKRIISLDNMVIMLDEICSVIFSFSFLVISILFSFGLYFFFIGITGALLGTISEFFSGGLQLILVIIGAIFFFLVLITGLIYFIDYITLGFFKKSKKFGKIYYPIYKFYGVITLSVISRSIYYYLISKFSKRRIRIVYLLMLAIILVNWSFTYDQYQYFPRQGADEFTFEPNYYDNLRSPDDFIAKASIQSDMIDAAYLQLFIRYDAQDNENIHNVCPDFTPLKNDGINPKIRLDTKGGNLMIMNQDYSSEDKETLLNCLSSFYHISINDSTYEDLRFYFYEHPSKDQVGLLTNIPTRNFMEGENHLEIKKNILNTEDSTFNQQDFAFIPFWMLKQE